MKLKSFNKEIIKSMPGIVDVIVVDTKPEKMAWSNVNAFTEIIAIVGQTTWQVMKAKNALKLTGPGRPMLKIVKITNIC